MPTQELHGTCRVLFCLDVAYGIDLRAAKERLARGEPTRFQHKTRVPDGLGMSPPLRLAWLDEPRAAGAARSRPQVEVALYDFGAVALTWSFPCGGPIEDLVELSTALYANAELAARAREIAEELARAVEPALTRPRVAEPVEDYVVFQVRPPAGGVEALLRDERTGLARLLRAEEGPLAEQEVEDALAHPVAYAPEEVCLVDWLGALLVGADTEDERLVLEMATVELLELRLLDLQLDRGVEEAYRTLRRRSGTWGALNFRASELQKVARIQADDAALHDAIDNALKMWGDDYLARLHRTCARRFHFAEWDGSIERKLGVLGSVYQSLADLSAHRRAEVLEWIIILLIAGEILFALV